MADAESSIGDVAQGAAPFLNFIPYVGPLVSAAASAAGGFLKTDAAKKQAQRAAEVRNQQIPLQTLRPEYKRKLNLDEMTALQTVPGYNQATQQLDASTAQNIRAIADRSPSGSATLSAIGNALYQKNQGLEKIAAANESYRTAGMKTVSDDLSTIGDKERDLEVQQHADKALLNAGATNLENASTATKLGGVHDIINSVGALGKLNTGGGFNKNNPQYMSHLKSKGYMLDATGNIVPIPKQVGAQGYSSGDLVSNTTSNSDMTKYPYTSVDTSNNAPYDTTGDN